MGFIVQAAGLIQSTHQYNVAARTAKRVGEFNARVSEEEAKATRESTRFQQERVVQEGTRAEGTLNARLGMSGGRMDVGTPLRVVGELAQEIDINQLLIGYEGEKAARRSENEAAVSRLGGTLTAGTYNAQAAANLIQAGGTLLQGFSSYAREFGKTSSTTSQDQDYMNRMAEGPYG